MNIIKKLCLFSACMILLLHAVVPHHHHNNEVCLSKLNNKKNNIEHKCCDSHNTPNHNNTNDCNESDCIIDDFFTPKDNHEVKQYLDTNVLSFSYYLIHFVNISIENILSKGIEFRRDFIHLIYHNPHLNTIFGLRAPPVQL